MKTIATYSILTLVAVSFGCLSHAQTAQALLACEAAPEVRKALEDQLDPRSLDTMKFPDRLAYERRVLEELIAKYPRELVLYEKLRDVVRNGFPEDYPALRNRWIKTAEDSIGLLVPNC